MPTASGTVSLHGQLRVAGSRIVDQNNADIDQGLYIIVDWHSHRVEEVKAFFTEVA